MVQDMCNLTLCHKANSYFSGFPALLLLKEVGEILINLYDIF